MKQELYQTLEKQLKYLLSAQRYYVTNAAQFAALIYQSLENINWVGFYFYRENQLTLGPFQGKPACTPIPLGRGVCGQAAQKQQTIIVTDVNQFQDHIVCDTASQSEIVVPILNITNDNLIGVLDIDSPQKANFNQDDAHGLENLVKTFLTMTDF